MSDPFDANAKPCHPQSVRATMRPVVIGQDPTFADISGPQPLSGRPLNADPRDRSPVPPLSQPLRDAMARQNPEHGRRIRDVAKRR